MKILIVGLGSMGKRRIRLIRQIDNTVMLLGVDSKKERRAETEKLFGIETLEDLSDAFEKECECAFICTSPLSHADLIEDCLKHNMHVFTEINLVTKKYDSNMQLAKERKLVLFLSSTFLYRSEIRYIQSEVRNSKSVLSYVYHVGQYLPDWHPWEKYTDYFIGDARTNGCREIMAIDFPWIYKTFGKIVSFHVKKEKKTNLKINYNDSFMMLLEHENGVQGMVMIDVVSRKAVRNLEIFGEDLYITWDGTEKGLKKLDISSKKENTVLLYDTVDKQDGYADFINEDEYRNEIISFFEEISGKKKSEYGFKEYKYILNLIDMIESGSANKGL